MSKKTKLVVGGCSYTFGANKEKDGTITWAEQLADRLDMELVNTAKNGMGNEFILTKLTEAIYTHNNIGLVIAMWSEFERIDMPISPMAKRFEPFCVKEVSAESIEVPGAQYRIHGNSCYDETNTYWTSIHAGVLENARTRLRLIEEGNHPYKINNNLNQQNKMVNIWNEWQGGRGQVYSKIKCLEKSLLQMLLFKQLVKSKGLDYMQCVGTNPYVRGEEHNQPVDNARKIALKGKYYSKAILDSVYFDELDEPKFIGFPIMKEIGGYWLDSLMPTLEGQGNKWDYDYRLSLEDTHPNTKGHKIFSDHLYNEYQKIYKSDLTPASE